MSTNKNLKVFAFSEIINQKPRFVMVLGNDNPEEEKESGFIAVFPYIDSLPTVDNGIPRTEIYQVIFPYTAIQVLKRTALTFSFSTEKLHDLLNVLAESVLPNNFPGYTQESISKDITIEDIDSKLMMDIASSQIGSFTIVKGIEVQSDDKNNPIQIKLRYSYGG